VKVEGISLETIQRSEQIKSCQEHKYLLFSDQIGRLFFLGRRNEPPELKIEDFFH